MTGFARGRGLYRFQSQLLCILAVAWSVLATSSCLGDSSSTKFSTTGSYVASNPAPDYLTTTGLRNMEVTGGTAQPVRFYDRGKVVMDATMTIGASAAFYYRSTGWGCFYSVSGTSGGSAAIGGTATTWQSCFQQRQQRLHYFGGQPGRTRRQLPGTWRHGDIDRYRARRLQRHELQRGSSCSGSGDGNLSFPSPSVAVAGGGGSQTLTISGQTTGYVTINGTASNAAAGTVTAAVVRVDIRKDWTTITGGTTSIIVGQKVFLRELTQPWGVTGTSGSWTVPGTLVKSYTQAQASAGTAAISNADLSGGTVAYYWIAGGAKNVSYTAIVGGISFSASTTFNVLSPICLSFTSTTTTDTPPVNCDDPAWGTGLALHFGSNRTPHLHTGSPGAEVTTPAGGSGEFGVTQLIKTERHQTLASTGTTTQTWSSNGAYVLDDQDGRVQYGGSLSIA